MSEIDLLGDAELVGGDWYFEKTNRLLSVDSSRGGVWVSLENDEREAIGVSLTPDTARSMASALNHFADQADKYKEGE